MDISWRVWPQTVGAAVSWCWVLFSESHRGSCWGCKLHIPPDGTFFAPGVLGPDAINALAVCQYFQLTVTQQPLVEAWEERGALLEVKEGGNQGNKGHLGTESTSMREKVDPYAEWPRDLIRNRGLKPLREFPVFPPSLPSSFPSQAAWCPVCSALNTRAEMEWGEAEESWTWVKRSGWVLNPLFTEWP